MSEKLTPEQIDNWRKVLPLLGFPGAKFFSERTIQQIRDIMQGSLNRLEPEQPEPKPD